MEVRKSVGSTSIRESAILSGKVEESKIYGLDDLWKIRGHLEIRQNPTIQTQRIQGSRSILKDPEIGSNFRDGKIRWMDLLFRKRLLIRSAN